ncbi:MAG: YciI family protein [Nocardioidaceae bacterium]
MTEYVVLIPGNEAAWAAASPDERSAMYDRHRAFATMLQERGHRVTGGAELTPSATARTVRATGGEVRVTDGPYAESAEQLTGFYVVESGDLEDLLDVVGFLAGAEGTLEVRACVPMSEQDA